MSLEDEQKSTVAIKVLLDYSDNTLCCPENENSENLIPWSPKVSYVRGSTRDEYNAFSSATGNVTSFEKSFKEMNLTDAEFFDTGSGKSMMLQDLAVREKEITVQYEDLDCTGCSSWIPCSRKKKSDIPLLASADDSKNEQLVSIGEYMGEGTETLGSSLLDRSVKLKPFFGCSCSTPIATKSSSSFSTMEPKANDIFTFSASNVFQNSDYTILHDDKSLMPKLLYSVTPESNKGKVYINEVPPFYIGSANYKNIIRLKAEERMKAMRLIDRFSMSSLEADETIIRQSGSIKATPRVALNYKPENCPEMWTIQPQELVLDSTKGSRVVLISNSEHPLRFKTKFDSKMLNVCPMYGTVPGMGELGLRIMISQYARKQIQTSEDDVTVIIGKIQKNIHVKISLEQKSKTLKHRTFMAF